MCFHGGSYRVLQGAYLTVGMSKTSAGTHRKVSLNGRALKALTEWANLFPNRLSEHYVFPAEKYSLQPEGKPAKVLGTDPTKHMGSWRKAWEAVRKRTGVHARFQELRHTAVTRMLEAGTPLTTVAAIVGWSPSTMFLMAKRYGQIGRASC